MSLDDMVFGGGYAPETEEPPADFSDPRSTADQLVARMAQTAVTPQPGIGVDPRLTMDRLHRKAYEDYVLNPNPFPNAKVNQPAKPGKGGETDFSDFGSPQPGGEEQPTDFSEFGEQTPLPQPRPPEANTETQQPLEPPAAQGPGYLEKAAQIVEPKEGETIRKPLTALPREALALGIRGVDKTIDWGKRVYNEFQEAKPADKAQPSTPDTPNQLVQGVKSGVVGQTPKLSGATLEGFGWVLKSIEDAAREHGLGALLTSSATGGEYGAKTLIDYGKKIQGYGDEQQKALQPRVASYRNIRTDGVGNFLEDSASFAGFQLGQGVVSTAPGLVANIAARRLGFGKAGQWLATMAPSFVQNYGDVYSDSKDDKDIQELIKSGKLTEEKLATYAIGAGVVMAALDVYGVEQILKEPAHGWPASVKDLGKRLVKGYVRGTIAEGSTEGLQQVVSEWFQANMGSNKSAYEQFVSILDNALGGAITGGVMAGSRAAFPSSGTPTTPPFSPPSASPGPLGLGGPPPGAGPTPAGPGAPPPASPGLAPPDFAGRAAASSPEEQVDILRQRGYSDEDIAGMSPAQFQGEVEQGLTEGTGARPGTRASPLQPEDLAGAESVTNPTPTPAQREAGNYQHTHAELPELGLTGRNGLSIETDAGGTRQGPIQQPDAQRTAALQSALETAEFSRKAQVNARQDTAALDREIAGYKDELNGKPAWTAPNLPSAYGRSKQIMGADSTPTKKQGLDFFIGSAPPGGNVFVIDQIDPKTGKFDEHKVMARFRSPTEAVLTYLKSYTDNAAARIGGLTMLTPDQFKEWTKDGHVTGPLSETMKAKEKGGTGATQVGSGSAESPSPAKDSTEGATTAPEGARAGKAAQQQASNAATVGSVPTSDAAMKGIASLFGENEAVATPAPQPDTGVTESSENKQTTHTAESQIEDVLRETGVDPATVAPVVIHRAAKFMESPGWDPVTAFGAAMVSLAYESDHAIYQELVNAYGQANVQAVLHAASALEHGVRGEEGGAATGGAPAEVHGRGVHGGGEAGVQQGGEAAPAAETHQAAEAAAEPAEHPTARAGAEQPAGEPVQEPVPGEHEQAAGAAQTGSLREAVEGKKPVDARAQLEAYARSIQLPLDSIMPKDLQLAFEFMEQGRDAGGALARATIINGLIDGTIKADDLQLSKERINELVTEADARRGGKAAAEGGTAPAPQGGAVPEAGKHAAGAGEGGGQSGEQHAGAQPEPGKPAQSGEQPAAAAEQPAPTAEQPAPAAGKQSEPAAAEQPAATAGSGQRPAAGLQRVRDGASLKEKLEYVLGLDDDAEVPVDVLREIAPFLEGVAAEMNDRLTPEQRAHADKIINQLRTEITNADNQSVEAADTIHGKEIITDAGWAENAVATGVIKQNDQAGLCYPAAMGYVAEHGGTYAIGLVNAKDKPVYHALIEVEQGGKRFIHDPTLTADVFFTEDVFKRMVGGWVPVKRMSAEEAQTFGRTAGFMPDPKTLGLPPISQIMDDVRKGREPAVPTKAASLAAAFADHFRADKGFKTILEARKLATTAGFSADPKVVEEAIEAAVVKVARDLVKKWGPESGGTIHVAFKQLRDLYSRQPNLGTRTSTSVRDQAYSTPIPLAYAASVLAGVTKDTTVLEPTAGNGALLVDANPDKTTANEINKDRVIALREQGFNPKQQDASEGGLRHAGYPVDVVLANPPFGVVRENGASKNFDMSDIQPGYKTNEIDHVIALRALEAMKDDGKAVLILGGISKQVTENEKRSDAYNGRAKREFFKALYDRYKVVDHFTVAGELYAKQGAAWPVDVIVIHGRGKSALSLPAVAVPRVLKTWHDVGKVLLDANARGSAEPVRSGAGETAQGTPSGGPAEQHGGVSQPTGRSGTRGGSAAGEGPAGVRGEPVQQSGAEPTPGERPITPGVPEPGRAGAEAAPGGRPSGLSAEDFGKVFDEYVGTEPERLNYKSAGAVRGRTPSGVPSKFFQQVKEAGDRWIALEKATRHFDDLAYENGKLKDDLSALAKVEADLERDWKTALDLVGEQNGTDDSGEPGKGRPYSGIVQVVRDNIKSLIDRVTQSPIGQARMDTARAALRSNAQVAKDTVTSAVQSADAALSGLSALFGGPKVSMGLSFDPETYSKAKPLFAKAAEKFGQFKDNLTELMRRMLAELETVYGMTKDQLAKMRPYVIQFMQDVQSGAVNLVFPEAKTETKAAEQPAPKQGMKKDTETENQVSYTPSSEGPGLGTLVPVNLKRATDEALVKLKEKVGNLDEFVRDELGYGSKDDMWEGLGAEQVDGVAMMIDGMKRNLVAGSIIGDQTGIGKGRQVAAMIRWAIRNNRVPVFFTAGPKLYVEMYDDMKQIGMGKMLGRNPRILATNTDLKLPLDREDPTAKISTGDAKDHGRILIENGNVDTLKTNYDMVFSTYSQIQTVKGGETQRRNFMRRLAPDAVFIFDESHKAGGQGAVQGRGPKNAPAGRAKLVRQLIQAANNRVVYSSATYAKRADVMDLYAATDMRFAVDNIEELGAAIASGGVPMQQVVAAMLVEAGQYIRRERSFAGVNYDAKTVEVDRDTYNQISGGLAAINNFSSFVKRVVKDIRKDMKSEGGTTRLDNAVGVEGAESTNFTSKLHNVINQILLSMKAAPAIEEAIAALKNGEKPVIAVANTMESFLQQYSEDAGLQVGKPMTATFNDVIDRYLERSREIRIKKAFNESAESYYLTDADLDKVPGARQAWADAKEAIRNLPLDDLPVSPIDFMRNGLTAAGYRVSEITGRGLTVDYSGDEPVLARRIAKELSIRGKEATRVGFQDGDIDAIILNQSGAEGLSLHASERAKDQRRRLMIVAQAEGNIDTHMQILGRIHRTGQVVTPNYIQLAAGIPAELRPTSILMKKMASLNANTTAARESAVTAKDVPDLMNEYGDEVAIQYVMDNPGMNEKLGNPVKFVGDEPEEDGAMRRLTGRLPMLSLNDQEFAWSYLMREYTQLLASKEAAGENALEAKVMQLKAITRERTEVRPAKNDSGSPFAAPVIVEKVRVVRLGKPYTSAEIAERVAKSLNTPVPTTDAKELIRWLEKIESGPSYYNKEIGEVIKAAMQPVQDDAISRFETYKREVLDEIEKPEREEAERARLDGVQNKWVPLYERLKPGARFTLKTSNGNLIAIALGVKQEGKPTNPLALSTWKADFAIADSGRHVIIPFSRLSFESTDNMRVTELDYRYGESYEDTLAWFEIQQREAQENRFIATGNMLAAYDWLERKGKITHYTDSEGHIRQGILTARNFELGEHARKHGRPLNAAELQDWMVKHPGSPLTDKNNLVTVEGGYNGDLYLNVKANKKLAGFIFLDEKLIAAAGNDLEQRGRYFRVIVPRARIPGVIERLAELQSTFSIPLTDLKTEKVASATPSPEGEQAMGKVYTLNPGTESARRQMQREIQHIVDQALGPVVHVQFPNEIRTTPSMQDAWGGTAPEAVPGSFLSANDLIKVVIGTGIERETAYHEIFHGYMKYYATPGEKALLKAETPRLRAKLAEIYNLTADEANRVDPEEVQSSVAAAYQIWRDTNNPAANSGIHIGVRAMLEKLWKMFQRIKNFLMFRGYNSFEDIVSKLYGGTFQRERHQGPQRVASPAVPLYRPYVPRAGEATAPEADAVANDNRPARPGWTTNMSRTFFSNPDTAYQYMVSTAPVLTERQKRKLNQEQDEIISRPGKDRRSYFTKEEQRRLDEISDRIRASDSRKAGPEQPNVFFYEDAAHRNLFGQVMPEWEYDKTKDYGFSKYRARLFERGSGYESPIGEFVTFGTLEGAQRWVETKIKTGKDIADQIRTEEEPQLRREAITRARENIHIATRNEGLASLPKSTPERWVLKMFDGLEKGPRKQEFFLPEGRMYVAQGYEEGLDGRTFQIGSVDFDYNGKDNTGRGAFTNYLGLIEKEASRRSESEGYKAVVVENVHNKRLAAFLERRGYKNTSELFGGQELPDHIKELLFKNAPPHYFLRVGESRPGPEDKGPPPPPAPIRPSHDLEEFLKNKFGEFLGPDEKAAGLSGGGTGRPRGLPPNMSATLLKRLRYTAKRYDYAQEQLDKAQAAVKAAPVRDYRQSHEFDEAVRVRDNAERILNMAKQTYENTVKELGPIGVNLIEAARQEATQQGIGQMIQDESKRIGLDTYEGRLLHGVNAGTFEKPALRMSPDEFLKSEFLWSMADRMVREAGGRTLRFHNPSSMLFAKREPAFDEAFMHLANYVFDKTGVGRQLTINDAREAIAKEQTDALMDRLTKPRDPSESAQVEWDQAKKTWIGNSPPPGTIPGWVDNMTFYFRPTALMTRHEKQLSKAVLDIAKQVSPGVTVGSVDRILPPQGSIPSHTTMSAVYLGPWWSDKTGVDTLIAVTLSTHPIQSYLHEVIHHLRSGFFYPHEWVALETAARRSGWIQHYEIDKRYTHKPIETQLEEAIADRYADWAYNRVLRGVNTPAGAVRAFRKLKNFFDRLRRKIYEIFGRSVTVDDLFTKVSTGEIGRRPRTDYGYDRFGARPGPITDTTEAPALSRRDFLKGTGAAAITAATSKVPTLPAANPFDAATPAMDEMFRKNVEYEAARLWKFYDIGGSYESGVDSGFRKTLLDAAEHNMEFGVPDDAKFYEAVHDLYKTGWSPSRQLLDKVSTLGDVEDAIEPSEMTRKMVGEDTATESQPANLPALAEPNDYMKGEGQPEGLIEHNARSARTEGERAAGLAGSGGAPPYPKRPFTVGRSLREIRQSLLTTWASAFQPEVLTDNALQADPYFARYRGARAQERDSILKQSESWWNYWNVRGDQERLAFLHEVETGQPPNDPTKNAMWRNFRGMLNRAFMEEQRWGSKATYWEEYFPHVWTDVGAATAWVQEQVRQLGPTWFQKHRFYDTIQAGLAAGLRLTSSNPVDLLTHRMLAGADMRMRMQLLYDLKRMGLAWEASQGGQPLRQRGWIPVNAPDRQQWMVAPDVQYLWKNAVEAKGLWQLDNGWGKAFRGWMMLKNAYVPIKLILSLFHPVHVLGINHAQYIGMGLRELSTGHIRAGVGSIGHGLLTLPTLSLVDYFHGRTAKQAWEKRKTQMTPGEAAIVKIMEDGGFVPQLSEEQRIAARRSLAVAWERASTEPWFAAKLPFIGARRLIEKLQAPIFEHWIPALKAAAYLNEAASFFMRNPHVLNDDVQYRTALRTIAKSIDNRYGEMFYGAVFQNRIFKDAMIASWLSYGWNFGFLREFIGGAAEIVTRPIGLIAGESQTKQTQRLASNKLPFIIAYVSTSLMIAGMMTMMLSGGPPDNLLDYIFPRMKQKNSDGSPRRLATPFYTREVPMLKKHIEEHGGNVLAGTGAMINNKLLIKPIIELYTNRDYYGYEIRNSNDPAWKQLWQHAQYLFEDATNPISVLGAKRAADLSGTPFPRGKSVFDLADKETAQKFLDAMGAPGVLLALAGFGPAPAYAEKSAIQNRIGHLYGQFVAPELKPQERRETAEEVRGLRTAILEARSSGNQDKLQDLYKRGRELGLSMSFMTNIGKIPTDVYLFSRLPNEQQISLIRQMTPAEKTKYWPSAHQKVKQLFNKEAEAVPAQ